MLDIVISWNYYKENVYFSAWNARQKKECVYFYDYDDYAWYIIQHMDFSELQRFRLHIYQKYQKQIKFTKFIEKNNEWDTFEWYRLQSPIIRVNESELAELLDYTTRKKYFVYDNVREKYYYKSKFINYVQLNV